MSDKPFVLRGGSTEQSAIANRINAIQRIKTISNVDLTTKTIYYLRALDMIMYQRWYKNEPKDKQIDEEWCQRAAETVIQMEKDSQDFNSASDIASRTKAAYLSHEALPLKEPPVVENYVKKHKPISFWLRPIKRFVESIIKGDR